jgi:hypothetical protein
VRAEELLKQCLEEDPEHVPALAFYGLLLQVFTTSLFFLTARYY